MHQLKVLYQQGAAVGKFHVLHISEFLYRDDE
jgi:hypothetical protein